MNENQAFLEQAVEFAQQTLSEDQYTPTLLVQIPDDSRPDGYGIGVVILADAFKSEQAKTQFEQVAPQLASEFNATRVALITEAWMLNLDKNDPASAKKLEAYRRGEFRLADLPDDEKTEILSIVMESHDGTNLGVTYELSHDPTRSLGRNLDPGGGFSKITTRWNFFPQEEEQDLSEPQAVFDLEGLFT